MSRRDTDVAASALIGVLLLWVLIIAGQASCMAKAEHRVARENSQAQP